MTAFFLLMSTSALAQVAGGTLVVSVPNAPGEIMLDGFPTGQEAPATLENVAPGTHLLQMEYGCMVGELEVSVAADKTVEVTLPMQYKGGTGTIRLKGLPNTATVLLDDAPVRSWAEGVEAKCGSRTIVVESPGFEDWETDSIITAGKWLTVSVELTESDIVEAAPAPRASARPVDDFEDDYDEMDDLDEAYADDYDDYDDYDELEEPSSSSSSRDRDRDRDRDRELERRQEEQEERRAVEAERRREAEEAKRAEEEAEAELRREAEEERRRQEEEERRSRYGDIASLDEDESETETDSRRRSTSDDDLEEPDEFDDEPARGDRDYEEDDLSDEFDDEDSNRFDDEDDYDELDEFDEEGSKAPRDARDPRSGSSAGTGKALKLGGTGALAAVAVGGGVMAIVSGVQYSTGKGYWNDIVGATGVGSDQEQSYWNAYVQPYKTRAIIGGVVAGVGLVAAGAWFFVAPDGTVQVGYSRRF